MRTDIESLPLLDSKLINATTKKIYQVKLVKCGNYCQVYYYADSKIKTNNTHSIAMSLGPTISLLN